MNQEVNDRKVAWNLSEALINELAMLLRKATIYNLNENYENCFKSLKGIRMRVQSSLNDKERENFKGYEIKLNKTINGLRMAKLKSVGFNDKPFIIWFEENGYALSEEIDNYNEKIMDILEKYGFLVKKQEDRTKIN